ncbi:hypothetical protein QBC41DRAFT_219783 [Cercophora samala]|uniref:Uncharacterized protein n=1 Tax=Cercophora samala TaxID=330535 RepID=A0AA39ZHT1_9PEZI|nr:hypothetical protein QBC41DRAFT_219783 [Cercophora samala]
MGTTYEMPHLAPSKNHIHHHSTHAPPMPQQDRYRPALNERPPPNEQMYNSSSRCPAPVYQPQVQPPRPYLPSHPSAPPPATAAVSSSAIVNASRQSSRPSSPPLDTGLVFHSMDIPECISPRGGNLAHFMAEVTALFWFESPQTLETAEKVRTLPPNAPFARLPACAVATPGFKKWVTAVVSTTQITQNVVLLALLYVYRLKMANPNVKGRLGSEYRLLTVALMLGNKFLDDNTYTNKTWADVSGIGVNEIHVMEVEFLSNMRYGLLVSAEQWRAWLDKLASFYEYLELAQRSPSPSPSPLLMPSPSQRAFVSPIPSPTATTALQSTPATHAIVSQPPQRSSPGFGPFSGGNTHSNSNNGPVGWPNPYSSNNAVSPLALKPEHQLFRKRSFTEDDPSEPPAKRLGRVAPEQPQPMHLPVHHHLPSQAPPPPPPPPPSLHGQHRPVASHAPIGSQRPISSAAGQNRPAAPIGSDQGRVAMPGLTLNTSHAGPLVTTQSFTSSAAYAPPQASPLSLPPLVPGVRAMATVYPNATTYAPQQSVLVTSGPSVSSAPQSVTTPTTSFPPMSYGTPTKRPSPQHHLASSANMAGSSPLSVDPFGHHSGTPMGNAGSTSGLHTPISHSPSIYLQQRNSPYKPVRQVNTLLIPPPSAFLHQYHFQNAVTPNQMHYQPLGRRNEYRTGIVPEYTMGGQHPYPPSQQVLPDPTQHRPTHAPPVSRPDSYRSQY